MSLVGLSRLLGGDKNRFVPLDANTNGSHGRAIYIDLALSTKFTGMKGADVVTMIAKLKQLSATAGGISSASAIGDAMAHMTVIGTVRVSYKVLQNTNDAVLRGGVYITDLDLQSFESGAPGLYKVQRTAGVGRKWRVMEGRPQRVDGHFAAINGACEDVHQAGGRIIPPMIEDAYNKAKKWEGDLNSEGYSLFFNPPSVYKNGLRFKTPKQKIASQGYAAGLLKEAMLDSQRTNRKIQWVVHGDGAKLLNQTLDLLGSADLSNQTILLCSPTENVSSLLPKLRQCKINLHDEVMKVNDDDWRSKSAQMFSGGKLANELALFPGFEDKADLMKAEARDDLYSASKGLLGAATTGVAVGTFLMSPAAPAVTIVSGAVSLFGLKETWSKAKSIRNSSATSIDNPSLNPHMQPFKTRAEMNQIANKHSGSALKTFADVLRSKLT